MSKSEATKIAAEPGLLDINEVCSFFGGTKPLAPCTIYRGMGKLYPKPVKVGPNTSRWLRYECVEALNKIIAARSDAA
jgi:predicted DNA-binding transcriptional regulator AlpA